MQDFYETPAGLHLMVAIQFMEGALALDEAQRTRGRLLFRPTLALAGQGLELMLKACMLLNGAAPPTRGRAGHDVVGMWAQEVCEPVRCHVFASAHKVAERDRFSGRYLGVVEDEEAVPLIEEYILELGKLHGGQPFPMRYDTDPSVQAPRTPFLVRTLHDACDQFVRVPQEFELGSELINGIPVGVVL